MKSLIFYIVSFLISLITFVIGAKVLLKKKIPLYFQLFLAASGCYTLQALCSLVIEYCGGSEQVFSVSYLGLWGCMWFLFCANHGAMNGLINDGNKPAAWLYIIPVVHTLAILFTSASYYVVFGDLVAAIIIALVMAPGIPVVFWNASHLCAKEDDFGFRTKISGCDRASIIFNIALIGMCYSKAAGTIFTNIMLLVCPCTVALLLYQAAKGAKQWNI